MPTSLADERMRGSLDVLMTTPMSTRSILWGKWLGTYRIVLGLAILPGVASVIVACMAPAVPTRLGAAGLPTPGLVRLNLLDRIAAPGLVVGEMLSYGAAITSMGLALAIWVPRLGRAIAINVVIFVLIAIGWPFLFQSAISHPLQEWLLRRWGMMSADTRWIQTGMMVISPFLAPMITLEWLVEYHANDRWKFWLFALASCAGLGIRRGDVPGGAQLVRPLPGADARDGRLRARTGRGGGQARDGGSVTVIRPARPESAGRARSLVAAGGSPARGSGSRG